MALGDATTYSWNLGTVPDGQGGDTYRQSGVKFNNFMSDFFPDYTATKSTINGAMPKTGGSFSGNVTFNGAATAVVGTLTVNGITTLTNTLNCAAISGSTLVTSGNGNIKGLLAVGASNNTPAGQVDITTASARVIIREQSNIPILDGVNTNNSYFGDVGLAGININLFCRGGDTRIIYRAASGNSSLDSVNSDNNAFRPLMFTATQFTFGASMQVNGNITASGSITPSDKRLKKNIEPQIVQRGLALSLAKIFSQWDLISNDLHQNGAIAQDAQGICPFYVSEIAYQGAPTLEEGTTNLTYPPIEIRLGLDKLGMAYEATMDNALDIDELKTALAAALARIEALENK